MYCVVPLAGPDFFHPSYDIKPFVPYKDKTLIESVLHGRSWYSEIDTFFFALQDNKRSRSCGEMLKKLFPSSRFVYLSNFTKGALLSSLAATSLMENFNMPLVIDLVDIDYDSSKFHPLDIFEDSEVKGILPYFTSDEPCYSYLQTDREGLLQKSAEKKVISDKASAGTYFFQNLSTFFSVLQGSLEREAEYSYNGSLFLCPVYNEIVKYHGKVVSTQVPLLCSVSKEIKKNQEPQHI
jgi:hypothetical protein